MTQLKKNRQAHYNEDLELMRSVANNPSKELKEEIEKIFKEVVADENAPE